MTMQPCRHILSLLLENTAGALSRVVGLFSARGYNIESLSVAPTEDPSVSRMTIVSLGEDQLTEQITKHLNRLVEVIKVVDLSDGTMVERGLMLVKLRAATDRERQEAFRMSEIFRARIVDVTERTYTVEVTGEASKLQAFLAAIDPTAILEVVQTGRTGVSRGDRILHV